ncbi:alpha-amylase family glycosyl hydrolase [Undibacterium sp. RTI2.1]|uniref:carbohydrate-binding module family 20 domain-containing protein n=1 Tax=unclassified Undibacterium TaxID=2630295 RepID=UPI002B236764|nr:MULTISPECIES: alpha-amylase family glycosyl hydrolase [unclassified Undibacterium]MEB0031881.1 alpha-amylase family glycosyl hydrolase [Undibacterium sp. RTI2.1]MEB0118161.1 alpha-amylase family glycosyl hydrolase [Undibacterium sp. RTI2.2]
MKVDSRVKSVSRHQHTPALRRLFGRSVLASSIAFGMLGASLPAQAANFNPADTSVQMFHWRWNDIAKECTNWLGPQGYGGVQISPPHASANLNTWYDIYQPVNFTALKSNMGTEAEFQSMINTCHAAKVRIYADVVVNHMAAGSGTGSDGSTWNSTSLQYPNFGTNDFHPACDIQDSDYNNNRNNVIVCRLVGLPDLKTEGTYVRGQVKNYLTKLLGMGVDGFRFDAAKHMAPADLQAFVTSVASTTSAGEPVWVTQEIIADGTVNRADYFSAGTINEFKFAAAMRETFRSTNGNQLSQIRTYMGTPGNWGGTWGFVDSSKATVFVNNWDTERNGDSMNASNFTGVTNDTQGTKRYDLANIFMLAWPYGHAQIHSGFRFSNKDQNAPSASPFDASGNPKINVDWDFIHRWSDIANMVAFRAATSGQGVGNFTNGTINQIAFSRGANGFVAINNDASVWNASFQTGLAAGTYCNVVHGQLNAAKTACTSDSVVVGSNGIATVSIAANGGSTVPAVALHINQKITGTGGGGTVGGTTCTTVSVKFRVANANTVVGQNVYVLGNRNELSNWTPATSMTIEGSGANVPWSQTIQLPPSTAIQYKFMKHGAVADVWESSQSTTSGNREAVTPACGAATLVLDAGNFKF